MVRSEAARAAAAARTAAWRAANRERAYAARDAWSQKNPERVAAIKRRWYAANKDRSLAASKANKAARPGRGAMENAQRKQATPAWADKEMMADIYALARVYREHTAVIAHVDHIVPLRSPLVCGLHTHDNLSCLPHDENIRKGNRVWPGSTGDPIQL